MIIVVFGIPTMLLLVVAIAAYAVTKSAYDGLAGLAERIIDKLPIVAAILFIVLVIVSIVYGMRKKKFWYGVTMFISWAKSIFFIWIFLEAALEAFFAPGNIFLTLISAPITLGVTLLPLIGDLFFTTKAWEYAVEEGDVEEPLKEAAIEYGIIAGIVVLSLIF